VEYLVNGILGLFKKMTFRFRKRLTNLISTLKIMDVESNRYIAFDQERKFSNNKKIILGLFGGLSFTGLIVTALVLYFGHTNTSTTSVTSTNDDLAPITYRSVPIDIVSTTPAKRKSHTRRRGGRICSGNVCYTVTPDSSGNVVITGNHLGV